MSLHNINRWHSKTHLRLTLSLLRKFKGWQSETLYTNIAWVRLDANEYREKVACNKIPVYKTRKVYILYLDNFMLKLKL